MGDQGLRASLSSVRSIGGDGTFKRCCLQNRKGYKLKNFMQVRLLMDIASSLSFTEKFSATPSSSSERGGWMDSQFIEPTSPSFTHYCQHKIRVPTSASSSYTCIKRLVVREELAHLVDYVEKTWIGRDFRWLVD